MALCGNCEWFVSRCYVLWLMYWCSQTVQVDCARAQHFGGGGIETDHSSLLCTMVSLLTIPDAELVRVVCV